MKHDNATDELVEDLRDYQKTYQGRAGLWSYGLCAGNAADKIDELRGALRDLLGYVTTIPGEIHRNETIEKAHALSSTLSEGEKP